MIVSNFNMMSKGAGVSNPENSDAVSHTFTYIMADEEQMNFHMFGGGHEAWINHRDDGQSLNCDAALAEKLMRKV